MRPDFGAFVPHGDIRVAGMPTGPLAGSTFAAKDLYDVAGHPTGAGNPEWLATHPVPTKHAWAVQQLLDAGATLIGKTVTDELAYGMTGRNFHYGAPLNPAAPDRVTGGSSSGSASAVAGAAADFALGSDTGGSVRIPASYCGLFGLRPTHGRIPLEGVVPLAPSFDTVGWFTRDAALFERIGRVLLQETAPSPSASVLLRAEDAFGLADPDVAAAVAPTAAKAARAIGTDRTIRLYPSDPNTWKEAFRLLQAREAWIADGEWIARVRPRLGPDVQGRFDFAAKVTDAQIARPRAIRQEVTAYMSNLLADNTVLCLPTSPVPAPKRDASFEEFGEVRERTMPLTCIAGLAGLPQVNVPAGRLADGAPVGLSLIARRGNDAMLLALARTIAA